MEPICTERDAALALCATQRLRCAPRSVYVVRYTAFRFRNHCFYKGFLALCVSWRVPCETTWSPFALSATQRWHCALRSVCTVRDAAFALRLQCALRSVRTQLLSSYGFPCAGRTAHGAERCVDPDVKPQTWTYQLYPAHIWELQHRHT